MLDEGIAEKVNQMTKIVMASTADHPGLDVKTRGLHSGAIGVGLFEF
jgi:hypothetical protein